MAAPTSRSFVLLLIVFFLFPITEATDIIVGDNIDGWKIPKTTHALDEWAERINFKVGDYLVWNFENGDSALQVSKEDYVTCNTANPIARYQGVNNMAPLDRCGSLFYISGYQDHCQMGEKIHIEVGGYGGQIATLYSSQGLTLAPTGLAALAGLLLFTLRVLAVIRLY